MVLSSFCLRGKVFAVRRNGVRRGVQCGRQSSRLDCDCFVNVWQRCLQRCKVFEAIKAASNAGSWVLLKCCGGSVQAMKSCSQYRCALCPMRLGTVSRNVHLAIKWLSELVRVSEPWVDASSASRPFCEEKKLYGMNPQQNFRLFLTMEFNPRTGDGRTGICHIDWREDTRQFDPPLPRLRLRATFRSPGPAMA